MKFISNFQEYCSSLKIKEVPWKILTISLITISTPALISIYFLKTNSSSSMSMAGLQVSDADNWNACLKSIAQYYSFPLGASDWCMRRPIYSMFAGVEFRILGSTQIVLVLNALIFGLLSTWSIFQVKKIIPVFPAALLLIYEWTYWGIFGANQTMTESLGMMLGVLALGFICKTMNHLEFRYLVIATYTLSIVSIVRPGNLLATFIPIFFLVDSRFKKHRLKFVFILLSVAFIPQIILKFFARVLGLNNFLHGGNSWGSLYGLIAGNQDWMAAYKISGIKDAQSEIEMWSLVRLETLKLLREKPVDIFENTIVNIESFFSASVPFFSPKKLPAESTLNTFNPILLTMLAIFFTLFMFNKNISTTNRLLCSYGIITSVLAYGVLLKSDPYRTLSATQFVFVFFILYILFNWKKTKPLSKREAANPAYLKVPSPLSFASPVIILMALVFFAVRGPLIEVAPIVGKCNRADQFQLDPKTLETKWVPDLKLKLPGLFWWEEIIPSLPSGKLIQGLTVDKNNNVLRVNLFLPSDIYLSDDLIKSSCLSYAAESNLDEQLQTIGFREGKFG